MKILNLFLIYFHRTFLVFFDVLEALIVKAKGVIFDQEKHERVLYQSLQLVEEDSAWQVMRLLHQKRTVLTGRDKKELLEQVLEEREHADLFKSIITNVNIEGSGLNHSRSDFDMPFNVRKEFIRIGEESALRKYGLIIRFGLAPKNLELFNKILVDESYHYEKLKTDQKINIAATRKAYGIHSQVLIKAKMEHVFHFLMLVLLAPIYYLLFTPVAKLSLALIEKKKVVK